MLQLPNLSDLIREKSSKSLIISSKVPSAEKAAQLSQCTLAQLLWGLGLIREFPKTSPLFQFQAKAHIIAFGAHLVAIPTIV